MGEVCEAVWRARVAEGRDGPRLWRRIVKIDYEPTIPSMPPPWRSLVYIGLADLPLFALSPVSELSILTGVQRFLFCIVLVLLTLVFLMLARLSYRRYQRELYSESESRITWARLSLDDELQESMNKADLRQPRDVG